MCTKHPDAPWYRSQLGIDSKLPDSLFKAKTPLVSDSASVDAPTVPNDDVIDPLAHVDDAEDEPMDEGPSAIDSYSIDDLKRMIQFLPSDLRQFEYYGGGKWLGRCRKDESQTCLFAAGIVSMTAEPEAPEPEEGRSPSVIRRGNTKCIPMPSSTVERFGGHMRILTVACRWREGTELCCNSSSMDPLRYIISNRLISC